MAAKPRLEVACLPRRNHLQRGLHQLRQVVRMHGRSASSQIGPDSDERRERIDDLPKLGFGCPNVLGIPAECFRGTDAADVMTRLLLEHVTQQHRMCNYWMQLSHVTACRRRAAVAFLLKKRVARRPSHPRATIVLRETVRGPPPAPPPQDLRLPTDVVESRSCVLPRSGRGRYAKGRWTWKS